MHVLAVREGVAQPLVAREVRHDAQLDLRVVRRDQARAGRRDEGLADAPALRRADGDVLQVGVVGGQAPGDRHGLRVRGVHAAGVRVDHLRQLVGVGGLELRDAAVLEQELGQRVVVGELGEHVLVGRGLARGGLLLHRQLLPLEQDLLDLLGRVQVERLAGGGVGLLLELEHLPAELVALRLELGAIEQHAVPLHPEQHRHHRHLDGLVDAPQGFLGGDARMQRRVHRERAIGILGRVLGRALHAHRRERDARRALAGDLVVGDRLPAEVALRERVEVVPLVHLEHVGFEQRVVRDAGERDAVVGEHVRVEFQVLPDLGAGRVLEPRPQQLERARAADLLGRAGVLVLERQVGGALAERERHADQAGVHRLEPRGLGVESDQRRAAHVREPGDERRLVGEHAVAAPRRFAGRSAGIAGLSAPGPRGAEILRRRAAQASGLAELSPRPANEQRVCVCGLE